MRVLFLVVTAIALSSNPAIAAKTAFLYGAGTVSCGEWSKFRATDKGQSFQVEAWVDGFLSGLNLGDEGEPDFLVGKPNSVAFYAWLDNYCAAKPLDSVVQASNKLMKELLKKAKQ